MSSYHEHPDPDLRLSPQAERALRVMSLQIDYTPGGILTGLLQHRSICPGGFQSDAEAWAAMSASVRNLKLLPSATEGA